MSNTSRAPGTGDEPGGRVTLSLVVSTPAPPIGLFAARSHPVVAEKPYGTSIHSNHATAGAATLSLLKPLLSAVPLLAWLHGT